jgi:RNA polymerase sigma-70 factor (ECF subfamily)
MALQTFRSPGRILSRRVSAAESEERDVETELIQRCLNGDKEAFVVLVDQYKKPVFNLAYRMLGDYEEARDASQDTFLRVYQTLGRFRIGERFSPWLFRIAQNLCLDRLRSRKKTRVSWDESQAERIVDPSPSPEDETERREAIRGVREAVAELPEQYRLLVVLAHLQGRSYQEIGDITGLPMTIVKNRLFRARGMLREKLADSGGGKGGLRVGLPESAKAVDG